MFVWFYIQFNLTRVRRNESNLETCICYLNSISNAKTPNPKLDAISCGVDYENNLIKHFIGVKLNNLHPRIKF